MSKQKNSIWPECLYSMNKEKKNLHIVVVVQSLSCVQFFETPWTAAFQSSLTFPVF